MIAPTQTLTAADLREPHRTFAYGWRRDGRYLYIGATRRGLSRLRKHPAYAVGGGLQESDAIDIWEIPGVDVLELERQLIANYRPELNGKVVDLTIARTRERDRRRFRAVMGRSGASR